MDGTDFLLKENNKKNIINDILTNDQLEHGVNEAKAGINSHMASGNLNRAVDERQSRVQNKSIFCDGNEPWTGSMSIAQ